MNRLVKADAIRVSRLKSCNDPPVRASFPFATVGSPSSPSPTISSPRARFSGRASASATCPPSLPAPPAVPLESILPRPLRCRCVISPFRNRRVVSRRKTKSLNAQVSVSNPGLQMFGALSCTSVAVYRAFSSASQSEERRVGYPSRVDFIVLCPLLCDWTFFCRFRICILSLVNGSSATPIDSILGTLLVWESWVGGASSACGMLALRVR